MDKKTKEAVITEHEQGIIYDNIPLMIVILDRKRVVRNMNALARRVMGPDSLGEAGGKALRCIHALDVPGGCGFGPNCQACGIRHITLDTLQTRQPHFQEEIALRLKDGEKEVSATFLVSTIPLVIQGEPMAMVALLDITERKLIEQKLASQECLLRNIIDHIPAAVFWKDQKSRYMGCNKVFAKAAGARDMQDLIGKTDYDLAWKKDEAQHYREDDQAVIETGQPKLNIEETLRQADGSERFIFTNKVPLCDEQGHVTGVLGVFSDITQLKAMERELSLSQEELKRMIIDLEKKNRQLKETQAQLLQTEKLAAIGHLSAGLAHEIKNPLGIILLGTDSLAKSIAPSDEKGREYLEMIRSALGRTKRIIDDLLSFSRSSGEELRLVDLKEVIDSSISLIHNSAMIKGAEIRKEAGPEEKMMVRADAVLLGQVFINLFTNALDAMTSGGIITVKIRLDDAGMSSKPRIIVDVIDTGSGIPKENISKIFNPFFTTKDPGKGTGLGLSVAYMIVKRNGGDIEVESEEGVGTKFTVSLPLVMVECTGGKR